LPLFFLFVLKSNILIHKEGKYFHADKTWTYRKRALDSVQNRLALGTINGFKMNLKEIGFVGVDWIRLAQDRVQWRALVNTVMNLWVP
jgi:hypothetical protein